MSGAPGTTPGDWHVLDCTPIGRILISSKTSKEAVATNGRDCVVARISLDNRPETLAPNNVADAHQIAASPALYDASASARDALQAMMDAWLDYHDAHSLTEPVTGAAGNAFDLALAARDECDAAAALARGETA